MPILENLIVSTVATSQISESDLLFLFSKGERRIYSAGEYLFQEGDPCLWIGIIEDGLVELLSGKDGETALISVLSRGVIIDEAAMTGNAFHDVSAYTRNGATVWQVPIDVLTAAFQTHPEMYFRIIARFAIRQRYAADKLEHTQETLQSNYDWILKENWLSKAVLDYILNTAKTKE